MKKKKPEPPENHERWLVSYADYMTLLFALFVVLYAFAMAKQSEYNAMVQAFMDSMGKVGLISRPVGDPIFEGGTGILEVEQKSAIEKKEDHKQEMSKEHQEKLIPEVAVALSVGNAETNAPEDLLQSQSATMLSKRKDQTELLGKLQKQFQNQRVEVEQLGQQLLIRITDTTLFPAGSAFLQPRLTPLIEEIASVLKDIPGTIVVTGHTDNLQTFDSLYKNNWELSSLRAVAIVQEMLKNKQIQPNRIIAQGRADTQPLLDNSSPENRAKNRRIEIVVTQGEAEEVKAVTVEKTPQPQ
jgi:chemotaxis protein MotB